MAYIKLNFVFNVVILPIFMYFMISLWDGGGEIVVTRRGRVRGGMAPDGDYFMFLGIPYAGVDINNPFGASLPYPRFDGVFEANNGSKICPQFEEYLRKPVGSLDCLNLNIYVPRSRGTKPVIIFIYGGQFRNGNAANGEDLKAYGPKFMMQHDVVLVTINYRTGVYGFFCLDTPEVPGNQGLKDQVTAINWIRENIQYFGGDPNRITLMGHSSGAMCVDLHVHYNPHIFNQAIIQSGTASIPDIMMDANPNYPIEISAKLGYQTTNLKDALNFIINHDLHEIINATKTMQFRPCVEQQFEEVKGMIFKHPLDVKLQGKKRVLIGNSENETIISLLKAYSSDTFLIKMLRKFYKIDLKPEMVDEVMDVYKSGDVKSQSEFITDVAFYHPTRRAIDKYLDSGFQIYNYVFAYSGKRNIMKLLRDISAEGTLHGDDLGYLFHFSFINNHGDEEMMMLERMTTMWTNFAKFGNPTPHPTTWLLEPWRQTHKHTRNYLLVDRKMSAESNIYRERMEFWDHFYKQYDQYIIGYRK